MTQSGCSALERVKISAMIVSHGRYVTFRMALTAAGDRVVYVTFGACTAL